MADTALDIEIVRVYEDPGRHGHDHRILVDRLWPRGVRKDDLELDEWRKDLAPSTELRRWYGHDPARFREFAERYRSELSSPQVLDGIRQLAAGARKHHLVLLTATRDVEHSGAEVLRSVIDEAAAGGARASSQD